MNQPLGKAAGNSVEIAECVKALDGDFPPDLHEVTMKLATELLRMAGIENDESRAMNLLDSKIAEGSAFRKFEEMVMYQGGNLDIFVDCSKLPRAPHVYEMQANKSGYVQGFHTEKIGRLIVEMGGGRLSKEDRIDALVGLVFHKKIGDFVGKKEIIVEIHSKSKEQSNTTARKLESLITIGNEKTPAPRLIKERLA
jgi:pyrimidine-nucleoside phosphorylase